MLLYDQFADVEPEPGAWRFGVAVLAELVEFDEKIFQIFLADARAMVGYANVHLVFLLRKKNLNRVTGMREFCGVGNQVIHNLKKTILVTLYSNGIVAIYRSKTQFEVAAISPESD